MKINHPVSSHPISLRRFSLAALVACVFTAHIQAATNDYYWTAPGSGDGGTAAGGTGTWDTSSLLWRNNTSNGTLTAYPTSATDTAARFTGAAGTVTLATGTNILANQLIFNTTGYTLAGASGSTLTLNGTTPSISTNSGIAANISATLAGTAGLLATGSGTTTLTGANTFIGGIAIRNGQNLVLDYTLNSTVVTSQNLTLGFLPGAGLVQGAGATLTIKGNSSGTTSQSLGSVTFGPGQNRIVVDKNGGGGTSLALGTITRDTSGTILFDLSSGGTLSANLPTADATTGRVNLVDNVLVAGSTSTSSLVGLIRTGTNTYDFASSLATGAGAPITALGATTDLVTSGGSTSNNYKVSGSKTIAFNATTSSVRVDTTAANNGTLTISSGQFLTLGKNTILFDGTGNYNIAGPGSFVGTSALLIQQWSTGTVTIGSDVLLGSQRIDKFGTGLLVNNSTSTNLTSVNVYNGVYRAGSTAALGSGNNTLGSGGILELTAGSSDYTRSLGTGSSQVQFLSDGGFSASGGDRVVALGGTASPTALVWNSTANFLPTQSRLFLGSATSDSTVEFRNAIDFNGNQREISVGDGSAATDARLTGALSSATGGGLYKSGAGTLVLAGAAANTYTGPTTIGTTLAGTAASSTANGGTLVAGSAGALGSGTTGTSNIAVNNGGTLLISNNATTDHVRNNAPISLGSTGGTGVGGTIKIATGVSEGSAATVTGGTATGTNMVGLGALTLVSNSTLDFDAAGTSTLLVFSSLAPGGNTLNVINYANANFNGANSSGLATDDRLVFNFDVQGAGYLNNILFNGVSGVAGEVSLGGGFYEVGIVAVPEPATWIAGLSLVGVAAVYGRRRLRPTVA